MSIGPLLAFAALAAPADSGEPGKAPATETTSAFSWSAEIKVDVIGPVSGIDSGERGYVLDESSLTGSLDLDKAIGWTGGSIQGWLRNTSGGAPNENVGALEGVSNVEARPRLRLFEFYLQQNLPNDAGDVRVGLIGLDSSFYVTESSGLLVNPAFGIPAALASSGPGGPPIYPSSALAVQATWRPVETAYVQVGAFSAKPGTIGDVDDVDTDFEDGALVVGEVGVTQGGKLAIGAWTYTDEVDDLRDVGPGGEPVKRNARGAYLLAEQPLNDQDGPRAATTFLRVAIPDGETSPIAGDAQAGMSVRRLLPGRPDSELAIGARYTRLTRDAADLAADAGEALERAEYGLEISVSDSITPWFAVQPNVQVIKDPGGRRDETVWIAGLRLKASFSGGS